MAPLAPSSRRAETQKKPLFLKSYVASREAAHQLAMYTAMDGVDALRERTPSAPSFARWDALPTTQRVPA